MTKEEIREEIDAVKMVTNEYIQNAPTHPTGFNWGFLWLVVKIGGKRLKFCAGSACPASWHDLEIAVQKIREVEYTYVNMD